MPLNWLAGAAAHAARRVERLKREEPVDSLKARPGYALLRQDLAPALKPDARVVEIRFADPVAGLLVPRESATAAEAVRLAADASRSGAAAVALWVERNFHAGDYAHLDAVRAACPELPLIARDLIVDPWQLERCRAGGADAVELIPELLGSALGATADAARGLGLTPLVCGPDGRWRPAETR
jgi:indole-3-glycerol phosphate synthase